MDMNSINSMNMMNNGNMMSTMMNTNLIGMMSMKENVSFYQILFGIFVMNIMAFMPTIKQYALLYFKKYIDKGKKKLETVVTQQTGIKQKEILSSIQFICSNDKVNNDIIFNSINYYITNNDNAKFLHFGKDFSVTNSDLFKLNETIFCRVKNQLPSTSEEEKKTDYSIELFSYDIKLAELKKFVESLKQKYLYEQKNKLGQQKFYFDEKHIPLQKDHYGNIRFETAPKSLYFTMTPFHTNKSLNNVFGDHLDEIKERVNMFLNNREWYNKKGVPYTLGIMLHGPPGTGKTSLIKAIAKDSKRHVFNIKFREDSTQTQLRNLFFNETIDVIHNGKNESFNIPIEERIYVIEDIDCLTNILDQRKTDEDDETSSQDNSNNYLISPDTLKKFEQFKNLDNQVINNQNTRTYSDFYNSYQSQNYKELSNTKKIFGSESSNNDNEKNSTDLLTVKTTYNSIKSNINDSEKLNLSFILNLMDGILETPGRILIVTSNHPEKLDKAFIRPGRIDINLEVGYCTNKMIQEMFEFFYEIDCTEMFKNIKNDLHLTPAEVNKIILNNFNNSKKAFDILIKTHKAREI